MSTIKTLIEATEIPEFKAVLQNWDDSHSPDEAANEMAKVLKGQQPKAFLTWLVELSNQEISPGKFKLKKDIIQESVRLLGDILVEKSTDSPTRNSPHSLSCFMCASPVQQDFTKVDLGVNVEKVIQIFESLKMHWTCSLCKDKIENKKMVDCGEIVHEEVETKSLEINKNRKESSDAVDAEASRLGEVATNLEIGTDVQEKLPKQTTNQEVQTMIEELETENQQTIDEQQKELLVEKTSNVKEAKETVVEVIETKNNSTQTDTHLDEEEYRKKIEREVQIAYEIKMVQEKQKRSKELSKNSEMKQHLEVDKCQLEMEKPKAELENPDLFVEKPKEELENPNLFVEKPKVELENPDLFVEKYEFDRFGTYRVRKTLKPIKNQKDSVSDVENNIVKLRNKLERILDNGGDWRDTMDILKKLDKLEDINLQILTSTKIVWTVNDLRRYSRHPEVVEFARKVVKRFNRIMPKNYRENHKDQRKTSKDGEKLSPERNHDYRGKYQDNHRTMKSNDKLDSEEKENKKQQHNKDFQNFTNTFDNLQILGQNKMQNGEKDVPHVCGVACINGHK